MASPAAGERLAAFHDETYAFESSLRIDGRGDALHLFALGVDCGGRWVERRLRRRVLAVEGTEGGGRQQGSAEGGRRPSKVGGKRERHTHTHTYTHTTMALAGSFCLERRLTWGHSIGAKALPERAENLERVREREVSLEERTLDMVSHMDTVFTEPACMCVCVCVVCVLCMCVVCMREGERENGDEHLVAKLCAVGAGANDDKVLAGKKRVC